jgi:hypothetical protein
VTRRLLTAIACGALLLTASAQGAGDSGSYQDASARFSKHSPGKSTGTRIKIDYTNPDDPSAKPPAVRRVVLKLARGARFDTLAPELCTASDEELMAMGETACPAGSKVGDGVVTVDTGVPGPGRFVTADVDFFNNDHELIYLNTVRGTEARTVIRAVVTHRRIVTNVGMLPGTPPDGGAIDTVQIDNPPLSRNVEGARHSYVTTPSDCPPRGFWTNRLKFSYDGGVTQTVKSRSRCEDR